MELKELIGVSRYLEEDCYCPGEIYERNAIFYEVFNKEDECLLLAENFINILVKCKDNLLLFVKDVDDNGVGNSEKIIDAWKYKDTENNIKNFKAFMKDPDHADRDFKIER